MAIKQYQILDEDGECLGEFQDFDNLEEYIKDIAYECKAGTLFYIAEVTHTCSVGINLKEVKYNGK